MFDWFLNIPLDFRDLRATADRIESLPTKNPWKLQRMFAMKRLTKFPEG